MLCYRFEYHFFKHRMFKRHNFNFGLLIYLTVRALQCVEMPYSGTEEWRARIGQWENRKLRWYQAHHAGFCLRVLPHLGRVYSEVSLLYALLLLSLAGRIVSELYAIGLSSRSGLTGRGRCCTYNWSRNLSTTPIFSQFLELSLLLVIAGDVEINPGPLTGEKMKGSLRSLDWPSAASIKNLISGESPEMRFLIARQ